MILSYTLPNAETLICSDLKKHSLRKDPKNRWKKGRFIQHSTGVRTNHYRCFYVNVCSGVEQIAIMYDGEGSPNAVIVEGQILSCDEIAAMALNDGFFCEDDFWDWFRKDSTLVTANGKSSRVWVGKIIHWTDLRYGKKG